MGGQALKNDYVIAGKSDPEASCCDDESNGMRVSEFRLNLGFQIKLGNSDASVMVSLRALMLDIE